MTNELDTLATALYVRIDDAVKAQPQLAPWRPEVGIAPTLSDAELVTLAVLSALLGFTSERRWLRHARAELSGMFPYLPGQPGYNRRLRNAAGLVLHMIRMLAADTTLWSGDVWVADSTPVECGRSRETARRSDLAGWAQYGYCAAHSRFFWGLRLRLLCTLGGLPILFALSGAKADEREILVGMLAAAPDILAARPQQTIIADRQYYGGTFEAALTDSELRLLRPAPPIGAVPILAAGLSAPAQAGPTPSTSPASPSTGTTAAGPGADLVVTALATGFRYDGIPVRRGAPDPAGQGLGAQYSLSRERALP